MRPARCWQRAYNGGQVIAEDKVETTGARGRLKLLPDRASIDADGQDVSVITVAVTDAEGRVVPVAEISLNFDLAAREKSSASATATRVATSRTFTLRGNGNGASSMDWPR